MDLSEKLKYYGPALKTARLEPNRTNPSDLSKWIPGEVKSNTAGDYYYTCINHPLEKPHGDRDLRSALSESNPLYHIAGNDAALAGMSLKQTLFFDTETTGLAGGAGTVPFLVGLGYFTDEHFIVEQYFMRDYSDERAVLSAVAERFSQFGTIASYNGKCYDVNILSSRFVLSRMKSDCLQKPHLDLLFAARRFWRRRLSDCSLGSVEREILGFSRRNDVPGFLIPSLYFEYLRTKDAKPLANVFTHNQWDIISLAALTIRFQTILEDPQTHVKHPSDWVSLGRIYENREMLEEAAAAYRTSLTSLESPEEQEESLVSLSFAWKRSGQLEKAEEVWKTMISRLPFRVMPYEELAKYYEHRAGRLEDAQAIVGKALERIETLQELKPHLSFLEERKDLEYRLKRIKRKLHSTTSSKKGFGED